MTRITKQKLESRVQNLNMLLERPLTPFNGNGVWNLGHLALDIQCDNLIGRSYRLVEIVSLAGAEQDWGDRMSAHEMYQFLDGMVKGMAIRNAHLTQHMMKLELATNGFDSDYPLYSAGLTEACIKVFKTT